MEPHSRTDEELMKDYLEGDENAFKDLYHRYSGKIYAYLKRRLARKELVDDAFQGVFMKLHKSRDQYRQSLAFAPWIFTIARSVSIDVSRSTANYESKTTELDENSLTAPVLINQKLDSEMLSDLSAEHKQALKLRYEEERSFDEIAKVLDTSSSNARKIISRAIQKLREKL